MNEALSKVKEALLDSNSILAQIGGEAYEQAQCQILDNNEALTALSSPQQEPVAYVVNFTTRLAGVPVADKLIIWRKDDAKNHVREELIRSVEPLYTHPLAVASEVDSASGRDVKDAERYRWLRDKASSAEVERFWWMDSVDEMEMAIDAAMKGGVAQSNEQSEGVA